MYFKRHVKKSIALIVAILLVLSCISGCGNKSSRKDDNSITVALFPYVPSPEIMQNLLEEKWSEISDTPLRFIDWDCYYDSTPKDIDVFMYDVLFLDYFVEHGYAAEIPSDSIENIDGFIPCALEWAQYDGKYYGIPNLLCSNFLFYYTDDTEISEVENIFELYDVIGNRKTSGKKPADTSEGMVINFYDNFTYYYLEALTDAAGEPLSFKKAPNLKHPDADALDALRCFAKMSGQEDVLISTLQEYIYGSFGKAEWFNDGHGRCSFGYSENMSFMQDIIDDISVKTISLSKGENIQTLYCDVLSVNKQSVTTDEKFDECVKLANLLAGEDFLKDLAVHDEKTPYLLPARSAVYDYAAESFPMYAHLKELVNSENNTVCRFGTDIYDFQVDAYMKIATHLN